MPLCVVALAPLFALLHLATAQAGAPWPVNSHDSALTFAAPAGTPVHARYCAHKLSMEPLSGPLVIAPDTVASVSLLKSGAWGGRLVENATASLTSGHWQVDANGPLQHAWLSFLGFSSAGTRAAYFGGCNNSTLQVYAYSMVTGAALWAAPLPFACTNSFRTYTLLYNTFADAVEVAARAYPNPDWTVLRVNGSDGSVLWGRPLDSAATSAFAYIRPVATRPNGDVIVQGGTYKSVGVWLALLDGASGNQIWQLTIADRLSVTLLVHPDALLAYLAPSDSASMPSLVAIDAGTGAALWRADNLIDCSGSASLAALQTPNGTLTAVMCAGPIDLAVVAMDGSVFGRWRSEARAAGPLLAIESTVFFAASTALGTELIAWDVTRPTDEARILYTSTTSRAINAMAVDQIGRIYLPDFDNPRRTVVLKDKCVEDHNELAIILIVSIVPPAVLLTAGLVVYFVFRKRSDPGYEPIR